MKAGEALPAGWSVAALRPDGATFTLAPSVDWRQAARKLLVASLPTVLLVVLFPATRRFEAPIIWTLLGGFGLVTLAALLAALRHVARALWGVRLTTQGRVVEGWLEPAGVLGGFVQGPVKSEGARVELRESLAGAMVRLAVVAVLADGREVGGPEWLCDEDELAQQRALASQIGEALVAGGLECAPKWSETSPS